MHASIIALVIFTIGCGGNSESPPPPDPPGPCDLPPKFAYVTNTTGVSAYAIDPTTGEPTEIAGSPFALQSPPRFTVVDSEGQFLFSASFDDDNVSVFTIDATTGALTEVAGSPFATGDSPNGVAVNADSTLLAVANYISETISVYSIAEDGVLTEVSGSPFVAGGDIVAIVFNEAGDLLYTGTQGSLKIFTVASDGTLAAFGSSTFAGGGIDDMIVFNPEGTRLYSTFSLGSQISGYEVADDGSVSPLANFPLTGPSPSVDRPIGMDRLGTRLLITHVSGMFGYTIDMTTGNLSQSAGPLPGANSPVFESSCNFAYAVDGNGIRAFDAEGLTEIDGSPFASALGPQQIIVTP